jgi:hypothetical protein
MKERRLFGLTRQQYEALCGYAVGHLDAGGAH